MKELRLPLGIAAVFTALFLGYVYLPDDFLHGKAKLTAIEEFEPGTKFVLGGLFRFIVPPKYTVQQNVANAIVTLPKTDEDSPYFRIVLEYGAEVPPEKSQFLEEYGEVQTVTLSGFVGVSAQKTNQTTVGEGYFFDIEDRTLRIDIEANDAQSLTEARTLLEKGLMIQVSR